MFSVIISEKGGAERRETFDRTEINVGRVQGNDLMLPKGNVSKRHARLLCRDGRFIVTDLKSTNGTYVNGRKIAQATIVREGDKIYIGDFVLRIEAGAAQSHAHALSGSPSSPAPPSDDVQSDLQSAPPHGDGGPVSRPVAAEVTPAPRPQAPAPATVAALSVTALAGTIPPARVPVAAAPVPVPIPAISAAPVPQAAPGASSPPPLPPISGEMVAFKSASIPAEPPSSSEPPSAAERALRVSSPRIEPKTGDRHEVISHFPLEHDPDESVHFAVPAAPRMPSSPRPVGGKTLPVPGAAPPPARPTVQPTAPGTPFSIPTPLVGERAAQVLGEAPVSSPPAHPTPNPPAQPARTPSIPFPGGLGRAVPPVLPPPHGGVLQVQDGGRAHAPPLERATSPSVGLAALGVAAGPRSPSIGLRAVEPGERASPDDGASHALPQPPRAVDAARASAQRAALLAVVERVSELVDLRPLAGGDTPDAVLTAHIERALAEAVSGLVASRPPDPQTPGPAGLAGKDLREKGVDLDLLVVEARRELCELGPLTPLFDDEDVTEIQVVRHDYVVALHGRRQVPAEVGFTSEQAVGRAIRRLCLAAGKPLADGEVFVERRLSRRHDGGPHTPVGRMFAVLPRAEDHGHLVVLRKPRRADLSLEDLVRSGTISRAMAGLFAHCVAAHGNILVTGAVGAGTTTLVGALAAAGSTEDRVVVLQEDDELIFNQPHTISILLGETAEEGARGVRAAARVRPDRLVVGAFGGAAAAELVHAMGDGVDGIIAGARAPTLRQAVLRLTADIAASRPGLSIEVAREWLASVFDLAIEVARLRDGRHRVIRVSELVVDGGRIAVRDIFNFNVERTAAGGAIEGSFSPTGVVPALIEDVAARGMPVDPSIFRRHARGSAQSSAPGERPPTGDHDRENSDITATPKSPLR